MKLFFKKSGSGHPIVILHGLFGSSDNWMTQAKLYSATYKVYTVDLRNHGQSPHDDDFDYLAMVSDLAEFLEDHQIIEPFIIGHSMGGKVLMNFALKFPEKVKKIIVVDMAPRAYRLEHQTIAEGLKAIPIDTLTSRNDADEILAPFVPKSETRQFLLKNLQRQTDGSFKWKINLPVISDKLSNVGEDLQVTGTFEKPTLFVRGKKSNYVTDDDWHRIRTLFPAAELETMETGHWVQAEKPQEFVTLTTRWLNA